MIMETKETCAFIIIQIQKWFKKSIMAWVMKQKLERKMMTTKTKEVNNTIISQWPTILTWSRTALDSHRGGGPHIRYMRTWSSVSRLSKYFSIITIKIKNIYAFIFIQIQKWFKKPIMSLVTKRKSKTK